MNNNPSPGNKAGGLTTILEKSLGAAAKGGQAPLRDVYEYAEQVTDTGLRLHGHAGLRPGRGDRPDRRRRELICFTTGRGSAFGSKPAPTIKLATNSGSTRRWRTTWTSTAATSSTGVTIEEKGEEIFRKVLGVASGEHTKTEELGLGDNEFVPWQIAARTGILLVRTSKLFQGSSIRPRQRRPGICGGGQAGL